MSGWDHEYDIHELNRLLDGERPMAIQHPWRLLAAIGASLIPVLIAAGLLTWWLT